MNVANDGTGNKQNCELYSKWNKNNKLNECGVEISYERKNWMKFTPYQVVMRSVNNDINWLIQYHFRTLNKVDYI